MLVTEVIRKNTKGRMLLSEMPTCDDNQADKIKPVLGSLDKKGKERATFF
jgi:hypothetical protein